MMHLVLTVQELFRPVCSVHYNALVYSNTFFENLKFKFHFMTQFKPWMNFFKWAISGLFFLYFRLFNTVDSKQMFNKFCQWLDSNCGPLVLEATTLPTEPQPLPWMILNEIINLVVQHFGKEYQVGVFLWKMKYVCHEYIWMKFISTFLQHSKTI